MTLWFCQRDGRTGAVKRRNLDRAPMFTVAASGAGDALAGGYWLEDDGMTAYYFSDNPNGYVTGKRFSVSKPCVTVMAEGMGGDSLGHWHFADDGRPDPMIPKERKTRRGRQLFDAEHAKPPYRVPSMAEIARVKWNGLTVATTFAGCGGSSLGYRMAGYRVVWANEFVPIAAECYRLNARKGTVVDTRDVKEIKAEDVLAATGLARGELDLLDGSPPCQAFSTAGRREKGWGVEREYEHGARQKNEDLFFEFCRLLEGLRPRAFVAENVSGLVKGVAKGYFLEILARLKAAGYRVEARVVDAQWLGVPQQRQRLIYVGAREDLGVAPAFPSPLPWRYSVRDALPWIGRATHDTKGTIGMSRGDFTDSSAPPITVGNRGSNWCHYKVEDDVRVIARGRFGKNGKGRAEVDVTDEPALSVTASGGRRPADDIAVVGNSNAAHSRKGERRSADEPARTVMSRRVNLEVEERLVQGPETDFRNAGRRIDEHAPAPAVTAGRAGKRTPRQFVVERVVREDDARIVTGRGSRRRRESGEPHDKDAPLPAVLADGGRKNSAQFMVERGADISGYAIGAEYDRLNPGQQSDKYFSLVRADAEKPSPTVTAKGGSNPGVAGVVHPAEKRKFTIAELRRICAYPDDFVLVGSYAQQWERLGNSVPPLMMRAIAEAVRDRVLLPARAAGSGKSRRRGPARGRAASRAASAAAATRA